MMAACWLAKRIAASSGGGNTVPARDLARRLSEILARDEKFLPHADPIKLVASPPWGSAEFPVEMRDGRRLAVSVRETGSHMPGESGSTDGRECERDRPAESPADDGQEDGICVSTRDIFEAAVQELLASFADQRVDGLELSESEARYVAGGILLRVKASLSAHNRRTDGQTMSRRNHGFGIT